MSAAEKENTTLLAHVFQFTKSNCICGIFAGPLDCQQVFWSVSKWKITIYCTWLEISGIKKKSWHMQYC